MKITKLTLKNYKCFNKIEVIFHDRLTVIVGGNGSGKASILEGAAVSLGTIFTGLDGLPGKRINKKDAHLKAYRMGESEDVQPQYPVEIQAEGVVAETTSEGTKENKIQWTRSLNGEGGSTTVKTRNRC